MQTTTTTHRTIGDRMAAKLPRSKTRRTRPRPRTRRRPKSPPPKPRTDPRITAFKRRLGQTENGRHMLRLAEQAAKARVAEEVTLCGLE